MEIRQVHESDGRPLRDLHLRMYADSPNAFGESLAEAQAMPMERWEGRARKLADSGDAGQRAGGLTLPQARLY